MPGAWAQPSWVMGDTELLTCDNRLVEYRLESRVQGAFENCSAMERLRLILYKRLLNAYPG